MHTRAGVGQERDLFQLRPTWGRQWASVPKAVSKVLKTRPGLYKENVGQSLSTGDGAVKVMALGSAAGVFVRLF